MIIFLDLDGVIVPVGALGDADVTAIFKDPYAHMQLIVDAHSRSAVTALRTFAEEHDARIVIISSWRKFFPLEFTREVLDRIGLGDLLHDGEWYARFRFSSRKSHDIGEWLADNHDGCPVIAIDDEPLGLDPAHIRQIRPISNVGLTADILKIPS